MMQEIQAVNQMDPNGNPTGGTVTGLGIDIKWQDGPRREGDTWNPANGAFVEGVIAAALQRLEFFQKSKFGCRENALAVTKLQEALHWLNARTTDREKHGVEGTHQK